MIPLTEEAQAVTIRRPAKPDFRAGLAMVVAVAVGTATIQDPVGTTLLTASCLLLTFALGSRRLAVQLILVYLVVRLLLYLTILGAGLPLVPWIGIVLTMMVMSYPMAVISMMIFTRVPMGEVMASLGAMRIPGTLLVVIMVIYRYVPTLLDELRIVRSAARLRGAESQWRRWFRHPLAEMEHAIVPIIMRSGRISDELSAVAECKGLDPAHRRSAMVKVRLGVTDLVSVVSIAAAVVAINLWVQA